jgi:uncharacterized protein (TIGR02246 family)
MFSVRNYSMLVCGGIIVASIAPASAADADRQSMEATLNAVVAAWDRSDAKAIAAVYAEDGDLIVPDGAVLNGKPTIEAFYASAFSRGYGGTTAGAHIVRGHRVGASTYVADGTWSIDGIKHPGAPDSREAGIFTAFFVREKGQWRLHALREQSSATSISEPQ